MQVECRDDPAIPMALQHRREMEQLKLRHRQALRQRDDEHAFTLRFQDDAGGPYWAAWSCDGYDVANGWMEVDLGDSYALFSARVYTGGFRTAVDGYCQHADGARHTIREGGPLPNACAGASKVRVECGGLWK